MREASVWADERWAELAGFIVVPIALLWIVGGIVIGTIRWVSAGFRR